MSIHVEKAVLKVKWLPTVNCVRYSRKINIQKPAPPHYERAKVLDVCKPEFERKFPRNTPLYVLCSKGIKVETHKIEDPNIYALFLTKFFVEKVESSRFVAFVHQNYMTGEERFQARVLFHRKNMQLLWPQKHLLEIASRLIPKYELFLSLFERGMTFVVTSKEPQVAETLKILKKIPQLSLMVGILDGQLLSKTELVQYSQLPNLLSAQASFVGTLNAAAGQVVNNITYHQQTLVRHLEQHMELQGTPKASGDSSVPPAT